MSGQGAAGAADPARIAAAAKLLLAARREGALLDRLPDDAAPRDEAEALAMQDALAQRLGAAVVGWKIGATGREIQAKIGLDHPFYGRVFADTVYPSGIALAAGPGHNILEAELAVRLGHDLPRGKTDHDRAGMAAVVAEILPCIEINRPSYRSPFAMRGLDVIADNGSNAGLVLGAPIAGWAAQDLAAVAVSFRVGGGEKARGTGAAALGHPFVALAWLANARAARGQPLRAGDIVATGSMMGFVAARAGDAIEADFAAHGVVRLRLG